MLFREKLNILVKGARYRTDFPATGHNAVGSCEAPGHRPKLRLPASVMALIEACYPAYKSWKSNLNFPENYEFC